MSRRLRVFDVLLYMMHPVMVLRFIRELGYLPRIALPRTYNEKMLWRMIFDHNPRFVGFSDKLGSRAHFAQTCPGLRLPQVLWRGEHPADLPRRFLTEDFVVKANHGCGFNWFPASVASDEELLQRTLRQWLATDYSRKWGEWAYRGVQPQLFVEERIQATPPNAMIEFKVHVFHGKVFYTVVYLGEKTGHSLSAIFGVNGDRLAVTNSVVAEYPERALPKDFRLPGCYADAMDVARRVAGNIDYIRVDFMVVDDVLFGGEITVYPSAGMMTNSSRGSLTEMARTWDIRGSWFLAEPQEGWRRIYARALREALHGALTDSDRGRILKN